MLHLALHLFHPRRSRLWYVGFLLFVMMVGSTYTAQAQAQTCRDINQITVCGNTVIEFPATTNGGGFRLRGNVKIGPKGGAAVVQVRNTGSIFDGSVLGESISEPTYFHFNQADANTGTTDFIIGEVFFINDPTGLGLFRTFVFDHPPTGDLDVTAGRLFVDTTNGRIFLPAEGAVPLFTQRQVKRNQAYQLAFITRLGAETFFKEGGSVNELTKANGEFDLFAKKFKATVPIALKIGDNAENPNVEITMRAEWSDNGALTTATIDGFKFRLGGLLMDVAGVVVKGKQGSTPAEFEAATVKVLKADNPSVPNLDPSDATLIFQFSKLKYVNGEWSIGGVEVGVKDWEFGASFKMVSQTLGIITEQNVQSLQIKSTMQFGTGTDASKLPIVLKIGRAQDGNGQFKPVFQAGLTNFNPKLGVMTFKLQNATFVGDAAQDFWGIKAANVDLQWPPYLGGKTAAGVGDFQLGMGNDKKVKFKLGNGTVGLPQLENNVFIANLQATLGVVQETIVMTGTGTFSLKLPGNQNSAGIIGQAILRYNREVNGTPQAQQAQQVVASAPGAIGCRNPIGTNTACPGTTPPPPTGPKAFELKLAGFEVKVAGFKFNVVNPRGLDDGGFAVDSAALSLPTGLSIQNPPAGGIQVQGLAVKGNGEFSIQGGGFELPPVSVGSVQLVALRGSFVKNTTTNNYEFRAGGKLPLPGTEPGSASGGISLDVVIRTTAAGAFSGAGVTIEVASPPLPPIPLGSTGFVLTRISGSFDLNNGTSTISLGVTAASQYGIPLGALGTLPIAKADGNITAQFNPFKFSGSVSLTVLIFQVADAAINIGDGQGFDNGPGMNVNVNVNALIMSGQFRMRAGKGTPTDPNKRRFAAAATFILGIQKGQYGTARPPFNLGGIEANLSGGIFNDTNQSPSKETVGLKANICGPNGNLCIGTFLNFNAGSSSSNFVDFTNLDKYVLIPAAAVRAAAARGEAGFVNRRLSNTEIADLGLVVSADQAATEGIYEQIINIPITQTTTLLAGIDYFAGTPLVRLQLPDNTILTEGSINGTTQTILKETEAITKSLYYVISAAAPGTYKLIIDNITEYEKVSYTLNQAPTINITGVTCGGSDLPGLTITCANGVEAVAASAPTATSATVTWNSSDSDSPTAKVSVGFIADSGDKNTIDFSAITTVAENLPLGAGSYTENLSEVGSGKYRMVVIIDDSQNAPIYVASDVVVTVDDKRAPAVPSGLTATPQAGELLIKWTQNAERDLAGYEIGFGLVNDSSQFVYTRTMGPKEILTGTNSIVDAKIWGLDDNTTVYYGLRAYDGSGNYSDWTPLQSATPWALSPNTWTPTPNGVGAATVEIGFAVPLKLATLETALTVLDAANKPVPGVTYLLVDFDSQKTVGVGFTPSGAVKGSFKAVLKGGASGVQADDGRTMGGDYTWTFTLDAPAPGSSIYLPLVSTRTQ